MDKTFTELTAEEVRLIPSRTDNERVDAFTDAALTANALSDPDNPPLDEDFWLTTRRCPRPGM
ncbi:MAG: hypothetical protein AB7E32_17290 [Desulfovibrio sp.]